MRQLAACASSAFASGLVGGIVNALLPILLYNLGLLSLVDLQPSFSKYDLYQKCFWGGVWGLVFMIRLGKIENAYLQATIYGLLPSLVQLFIIFPNYTPYGTGGIGLGHAMPFYVLLFNTLGWGWPAWFWFRLIGPSGSDYLGPAHDLVT